MNNHSLLNCQEICNYYFYCCYYPSEAPHVSLASLISADVVLKCIEEKLMCDVLPHEVSSKQAERNELKHKIDLVAQAKPR